MSVPPHRTRPASNPPRPGPGPGSPLDGGSQTGPGWWDEVYSARPGWDIDRPQPVFGSLVESGEARGTVLDVGCGTGEHVLMCAAHGLDATGCGLFVHVVDDDLLRTAYLEGVPTVLRPGGRYFMVCFRSPEDRHAATHHRPSSRDEIVELFAGRWQIDGVEPVTLDTVDVAGRVPAWRVACTRTAMAARPLGVDERSSC